jgi:serine/threonine-protein kinase
LEGATENPTLGRYEIVGELGKGAMGIVFKGVDPKIHREVAIKTIRFEQDFGADEIEDVKKRFFREAETAGRLTHPNIVTIYDVGEDWDLSYIAMELLEGEELTAHIRKGSLLPARRVIEIMAQACDALDYAHEQGVIHRDIKPANIMVTADGIVKILDFGVAKLAGHTKITSSSKTMGTLAYMSPEQTQGKSVDNRTDIFSLAVTLYELVTGENPFRADNDAAIVYKIVNVGVPPMKHARADVPERLDRIVSKALAKDPDRRYRTMGELRDDLRDLLQQLAPDRADHFRSLQRAGARRTRKAGILRMMRSRMRSWRRGPPS